MTPYYERDGITIFCGDCSDVMSGFEPQSFDLTVTSPPYDDLRIYNGYTFYFDPIAKQLYRVTKVGGVVVWVVGDQTKDGSESGTSFRQALGFMELGFRLHDTMIFNRFSPYPSNVRYWQAWEFMFVLSNGAPRTFNPLTERRSEKASKRLRSKRKGELSYRHKNGKLTPVDDAAINRLNSRHPEQRMRSNVWYYSVGYTHITKDKDAYKHPAIFPEALARDHIISWSNPGDLVLDPMMGSGTTGKMAQQLGRRFVGIDVSEEYCAIAVERLRQPTFWSLPTEPTKIPTPTQGELC